MKSIDEVASFQPHSTTNAINRATVWDDGLFERAAADARLFESILTSGGDERIAIGRGVILAAAVRLPQGLFAYTAANDWPLPVLT